MKLNSVVEKKIWISTSLVLGGEKPTDVNSGMSIIALIMLMIRKEWGIRAVKSEKDNKFNFLFGQGFSIRIV